MGRLVIGGAIGDCVHVAGVYNFLHLAESQGYETEFLGPAVSVDAFVERIKKRRPDLAAIGYRLSPKAAANLFETLKQALEEAGLQSVPLVFGGTPPVAEEAKKSGLFIRVFDGNEDGDEVTAFLSGRNRKNGSEAHETDLIKRMESKYPFPLLRHHFGLPDLTETIDGIAKISRAKVLDVVSLGPDQNFQESFFRPAEMDKSQDGAGGVPIRTVEDLKRLYAASRTGNYPLMRCYSGTRDVFQMAELLSQTIHNAWCAVPLCWYNVLDGRGPRGLEESIAENQALMKWHGEREIPVEVNEAHHWSLRDAHDTVAVVAAYLAAYNAKKMGVTRYIAQYMFNNPAATSPAMDLAKMLAKIEFIESLHDDRFVTYRQVRAGLTGFPVNPAKAKGQLAASTYLAMSLKPHIVHVVGFCEADHAATADDVIESAGIVRGVIQNAMTGLPDMKTDPQVIARKEHLLAEARVLLEAIRGIASPGVADPLSHAPTIAKAIRLGLLDAPHLKGNPHGQGKLVTRMVNGACEPWDLDENRVLTEEERVSRILQRESTKTA